MKTPVTAESIRHHFTYSWWKYLLIAAIAIGLVDILYAVTAYRPPREKTIGFFVYGYMDETELAAYMDNVRENEMPDMEDMAPRQMVEDETYGPMQLTTYMIAGEGDVYLLSREDFLNYASGGYLIPLEDDAELMTLFDAAGVSLQTGWRRETETGENHLYGIPQNNLPGLRKYAYAQDGYLCVIVTGGNMENAQKFMRILCRDMLTAPQE